MATSQYDPTKNYTWSPDSKFVLNGRDFGLILNMLRGILSTPEASNAILAYEANKKLESILSDAVAEGKVVEVVPPGQPEPAKVKKLIAKKADHVGHEQENGMHD